MSNPVVWFEVMGKDGDKLRGFYGELFGWKYALEEKMDYGMVEAGTGKGIPGGVGANPERQWVTFYVATPDIEKQLAQATKLGGKVLMPRTALPGGTVLGMFSDPEGNAIGLVEGTGA